MANKRRKRSKGASADFAVGPAPTVGRQSNKRSRRAKSVPKELPKALEKSIDWNEWGSAGAAVALVGVGAGLMGSVGRYLGNTTPGAQVYDTLGQDGRLILQGAGMVGASALITSVMMKDVEAPFLNFKKQSTANYVNTVAFGAAAYRILTGLGWGELGTRFSALFDGNLGTMAMGPQKPYKPMVNTPAQRESLKRSFTAQTITVPGTTNQQYTSYSPVNQAGFHQIMSN